MNWQEALNANNVDRIIELVNLGADINEPSPLINWTALMSAIVANLPLDTIKWLIEKGADVNLRTNRGITALMLASRHAKVNGIQKIKLLLEEGAEINAKDVDGYTPLLVAIRFSDTSSTLEAIKFLVENGANLFDKLNDGRTAIDLASTQEIKDFLSSAMWKQLYRRDMDLALKYSRSGEMFLPKEIWEIILLNKRQQLLCANLKSSKNVEILFLFASELGIPVTRETTKGQLCALISRQLSYGKHYNKNLVNEMNKYKSQILELARKFNIDTSKPIDEVIQQMSKLF